MGVLCWTMMIGVVMMSLLVGNTGAISCLECNVYFQGQRGTACHSPMTRTDCVACMKVTTKIQMNEGWLMRRTASVESKYCARLVASSGLMKEGCYFQQNNGGYTERCFCYSDQCNQAAKLFPASSLWTYVAVLSLALFALLFCR